jgi:peptidoglycan/LPS O-acetylase OafA/YrhL
MRGLAAIFVALHHLSLVGIVLVPGGFLAVDFFFALSGLVIGRAYADRIETGRMSWLAFMGSRWWRLYPVYLAGTLIGFLAIALGIHLSGGPAWHGGSAVAWTFSSLLLVPSVLPMVPANPLYPANPPAWSLFFELLANLIFAMFLYRVRTYHLLLFAAANFISLSAANYLLKEGNSPIWLHAFWAVPRVMFSFTVGMILARVIDFRAFASTWLAPIPAILLIATLVPQPHLRTSLPFVGLLYPMLLVLGTRWEFSATANGWCAWLGDISYPLYGVHYPLLFLWHAAAVQWSLTPLVESGGFLIVAVLAATLLAKADAAVRRRMTTMVSSRRNAGLAAEMLR